MAWQTEYKIILLEMEASNIDPQQQSLCMNCKEDIHFCSAVAITSLLTISSYSDTNASVDMM